MCNIERPTHCPVQPTECAGAALIPSLCSLGHRESESRDSIAQMLSNPITYAVNGKQYVTAIAGLTLYTFALPD